MPVGVSEVDPTVGMFYTGTSLFGSTHLWIEVRRAFGTNSGVACSHSSCAPHLGQGVSSIVTHQIVTTWIAAHPRLKRNGTGGWQ